MRMANWRVEILAEERDKLLRKARRTKDPADWEA